MTAYTPFLLDRSSKWSVKYLSVYCYISWLHLRRSAGRLYYFNVRSAFETGVQSIPSRGRVDSPKRILLGWIWVKLNTLPSVHDIVFTFFELSVATALYLFLFDGSFLSQLQWWTSFHTLFVELCSSLFKFYIFPGCSYVLEFFPSSNKNWCSYLHLLDWPLSIKQYLTILNIYFS